MPAISLTAAPAPHLPEVPAAHARTNLFRPGRDFRPQAELSALPPVSLNFNNQNAYYVGRLIINDGDNTLWQFLHRPASAHVPVDWRATWRSIGSMAQRAETVDGHRELFLGPRVYQQPPLRSTGAVCRYEWFAAIPPILTGRCRES